MTLKLLQGDRNSFGQIDVIKICLNVTPKTLSNKQTKTNKQKRKKKKKKEKSQFCRFAVSEKTPTLKLWTRAASRTDEHTLIPLVYWRQKRKQFVHATEKRERFRDIL